MESNPAQGESATKDDHGIYVEAECGIMKTLDFNSPSRARKRDIILAEDHSDSEAQITMSPEEVDALQATLSSTPKHRLYEAYSSAASLDIIADYWGVNMSTFPRPHHGIDFRPAGDVSAWDTRLLAHLTVLSEFALGQGALIGTHLCYAVELRNKKDEMRVKEIDVKRIIKDLLMGLSEAGEGDVAQKRKA
ncbi:hypothetical protein EK21DRAFT_83603 [Setomelanomma holmii]|uniref:Uncharacterized protein n=1 Tax=Setomelanomma holmii TaxID=210430 RepID=A0A9P4LUC7_9PLEO|nr:hypothetical protein EK21DRAFT_83603 [Setomelanomma holmii]